MAVQNVNKGFVYITVLRIGSAHNTGGLADINIAQISYPSNFFDKNFDLY